MIKNNEKIWRWVRIVIPILIVLIATVFAYGRLNNRVETLEGQVEKAVDTRERVIRIEEGVVYLKEAVKRIEAKLE